MVDILQGDSGAPCHLCTCSSQGINDLLKILAGFDINKTYEQCLDTWEKLVGGNIKYSDPARAGQCHAPLADVKVSAVLHWKLRSFDWLLQVYYRLIAGVKRWGVSHKPSQPFVKSAKQQAIDFLRQSTGMLIDTPTSAGGNTNTGELAERFLHPDNQELICSLISNTTDRENFSVLLRDLNIMLRVTQSTKKGVHTTKLRQLGIDIMSHVRSAFLDHLGQPWINITPSLHAMCAHSWQLIDILDAPVALYSEQAQEHWNKYLAKYKSGVATRARQHSVRINILDIFQRMMAMTHPKVASKRRRIICQTCKKEGHTAFSKKHHGYGPKKWEDSIVDSYYVS